MMHKFDFMRCALKTMETLPILVNDVEAMEEFNTHLSLVFQHRNSLWFYVLINFSGYNSL